MFASAAKRIQRQQSQIDDGSADENTQPVMQDYSTTSCGWYSQLDDNSSSDDIEAAILKMLYVGGDCGNP